MFAAEIDSEGLGLSYNIILILLFLTHYKANV